MTEVKTQLKKHMLLAAAILFLSVKLFNTW